MHSDEFCITSLAQAVRGGNIKLVFDRLIAGAFSLQKTKLNALRYNLGDQYGTIPLEFALRFSDVEYKNEKLFLIVKKLLEFGANLNSSVAKAAALTSSNVWKLTAVATLLGGFLAPLPGRTFCNDPNPGFRYRCTRGY